MDGLEFTRIAGREIDDQAIAELRALLPDEDLSPSTLLRLSAAGPIWVARRPCGATPEIVGAAAVVVDGEGLARRLAAIDPQHADLAVLSALQARLATVSDGPSLFPNRRSSPLGLTRTVA